MKSTKKIMAIILTVFIILCLTGISASADTVTLNGLDVSLTSDKTDYKDGDQIITTLEVKNTTNSPVEKVRLETLVPDGFKLADNTESAKYFTVLNEGAVESLTVTFVKDGFGIIKSPKTGVTENYVLLFGILTLSAVVAAVLLKTKKVNHGAALLVALVFAFSVSLSANAERANVSTSMTYAGIAMNIEGLVAVNEENPSAELNNFKADTFDIYVNNPTNVVFSVNVVSNTPVGIDEVSVVDENNKLITFLNDNGQNGDLVAGDSVFSGSCVLSSDTIHLMNYHSQLRSVVSNNFEINYYRDLTQNELAKFAAILNKVNAMTFEEAKSFVESSSEIESYSVDEEEKVVTYKTVYGITGVWETVIEGRKANGNYSIPTSRGVDYDAVNNALGALQISSDHNSSNVAVIRPFYSSQFNYNDFRKAGTAIQSSLNSSFEMFDDANASYDAFKSLADYDVVLVDSHGMKDSSRKNYIVTGESFDEGKFLYDVIYYTKHIGYSADYLAGRIVGTSSNRAALGAKFVDKYYGESSLTDSFWFLGCCYSLYSESLSDALLAKGANAIMGYTDSVTTGYCNETLFEGVINEMLLSEGTVDTAVNDVRNIYGQTDPGNQSCVLEYRGNADYKFVRGISGRPGILSGKVCKASDRTTLIPGATISTFQGNDLIDTFVTDNDGLYSLELPAGEYRLVIEAEGYIGFTYYVDLAAGEQKYLETFLLVEGDPNSKGIAEGVVNNALTGRGVADVELTIRAGWNAPEDIEVIATVKTDENGKYSVELPLGNYTVYTNKTDFISSSFNIISQEGVTGGQDGSITPELSGDDYRIVLTWGKNPRDLDSHVSGVKSDGRSFHVYYPLASQQAYDSNGVLICNLDKDDTDSYGPETITLHTSGNEPYYYYIKHYAGSGTLVTSEAKIQVYQGANLVAEYNVPTDVNCDSEWNWNVFAIKNGNIITKNTITSSPDLSYAE